MITAIALMCSYGGINDCEIIVKGDFFLTHEECMTDLSNALGYADSQGKVIRDFKCIVWSEPT